MRNRGLPFKQSEGKQAASSYLKKGVFLISVVLVFQQRLVAPPLPPTSSPRRAPNPLTLAQLSACPINRPHPLLKGSDSTQADVPWKSKAHNKLLELHRSLAEGSGHSNVKKEQPSS